VIGRYPICWAVVAMILSVWSAAAQGPSPELEHPVDQADAPSPPMSLTVSADTQPVETENGSQLQSQVSNLVPPLSGAQDFGSDTREVTRNFLLPAVSFYQWVETSPQLFTARPGGVAVLSTILGDLDLERTYRHSGLALRYSGGGTVSAEQTVPGSNTNLNSVMQQLDAMQTVDRRRFKLLMGEQFSYLPESSFGLFLTEDTLGEGRPSLRPTVTPDQSIYTGYGERRSATFLTQGEYRITPLSTVTVAGAYGTLRFSERDLINSNSTLLSLGYNRQFSRSDTAALIYRFDNVGLTRLGASLDDHIAQVSYGRRITGRLAFRFAGGPEFVQFRSNELPSQSELSWSLESGLHYRLNRTAFDLFYEHEVTAGAGVLLGAELHELGGKIARSFSTRWTASASTGYANNRSIAGTIATSPVSTIDTWFTSLQIQREIGRSAQLFAGYSLQLQHTSAGTPTCLGAVCGSRFTQHQIYIGMNLQHTPIGLR
jgi:hypothetical protein